LDHGEARLAETFLGPKLKPEIQLYGRQSWIPRVSVEGGS